MATFTCPECGETHVMPKSGPFNECCLRKVFKDCALDVVAHEAADSGDALLRAEE